MLQTIQELIPLLATIFLAYGLKKIKFIDPKTAVGPLNQISFDVVLPFMLFEIFAGTNVTLSFLYLPFIVISFVLVYTLLYSLLIKFRIKKNVPLLLTMASGLNVGAFYPFMKIHFSDEIFSKFVFLDIGSLVILFTLSVYLASQAQNGKEKINIIQVLKKLFLNPIMLAMALGICFGIAGIKLPEYITGTTSYISSSFGFMVAFVVGLNFEFPTNLKLFVNVFLHYSTRIISAIIFAIIISKVIGWGNEMKQVLVLMLSTPYAMLTAVYAEKYKLDTKMASQYVTVSLFIFILILPFLVYIAERV